MDLTTFLLVGAKNDWVNICRVQGVVARQVTRDISIVPIQDLRAFNGCRLRDNTALSAISRGGRMDTGAEQVQMLHSVATM